MRVRQQIIDMQETADRQQIPIKRQLPTDRHDSSTFFGNF